MISLTSPLAIGLLMAVKPISKRVKRKHEVFVSTREPALESMRRLLAVAKGGAYPDALVVEAVEPVYVRVHVMLDRHTGRLPNAEAALAWLESSLPAVQASADAKALLGVDKAAKAGVQLLLERKPAKPMRRTLRAAPEEE